MLYVALLLLSHGWRLWNDRFADPGPEPGQLTALLTEVHADAETAELARAQGEDDSVRLAWWEWPTDDPDAPVVVLIHGSPGDGSNFYRLGPLLAARGFRVLAPDLPGFGGSTQQIPDYSIRAHSVYLAEWLDQLGVEDFHAVGFSLGGGVVLHLHQSLTERVRSLTLLSAVGVQELELLGRYSVNHAIHGAQLAAFWAIQELVPHFGLLDRSHMHLSYARNFFDSDQRPLREILESYEGSMLILHGKDDFLVPYEAALEHRRVVPQSRLVSFEEGGHFLVFSRPEVLVDPLVELFETTAAGTARLRAQASPERLAESRDGVPQTLPRAVGPTLLVWIFLLAVATLVSEDLTCLAAGLLVAQGSLGFAEAVLACALGIFVGDLGLYFLGRLGRPFLNRAPLRWVVNDEDLQRSEAWFDEKGAWAILLSRFLPGLRVPTYVTAGLLGMNLLWFAVSLLVPIILWTPLLVGLSYWLGDTVFARFESFEEHALPVFFGVLVSFWLVLFLAKAVGSWRGRRRWVGRFKRWIQWEFWPMWAFYPPVVIYVLFLVVRYRSATLFTAANPGIPSAGGLVGESKSEILRRLPQETVAPWIPLEPGPIGERRAAVVAFQDSFGESGEPEWPVVLKPDVGERGSGVTIARRADDIEGFLDSHPGPAIVQRYVPGVELGVFWIHLPGEPVGRIFSITDKQLPELVGDGESTLEQLILNDSRAVAMQSVYLERFKDRLEEVLDHRSSIRLVEVGTHCLGAVFVDGARYRTPDLEAAVDRIGRGFEGFHFGRFDLRAPSFEAFERGEQISVLELNGVSSESTHIYDPSHTVFQAWSILFEQWRLAFEIGRRNRELGFQPATLGEIWRLFKEFRARPVP